jgi:hypothetical protein
MSFQDILDVRMKSVYAKPAIPAVPREADMIGAEGATPRNLSGKRTVTRRAI